MTLRDVRNFVCQHPRQFRFALRCQQQTGVYTDIATGHGEGVDTRIIERKKLETEPRILAESGQPSAQLVEIGLDVIVVEIADFALPDLLHDLLANLLFQHERQLLPRHIPQFRQLVRDGRRNRAPGTKDQGQHGSRQPTAERNRQLHGGAMITHAARPAACGPLPLCDMGTTNAPAMLGAAIHRRAKCDSRLGHKLAQK